MKFVNLALVIAVGTLAAGCANPQRSRDMANLAVSATVMAQQVCSNCHGMAGISVSPKFPNLAGQTEPYLVTQLNEFKTHSRHDPTGIEYMWGLSRSLSDEQIQGLAAYYANKLPAAPPDEVDRSSVEAGKVLFANGIPDQDVPACATCHGAQAQGNATFPRLAGQHADYLVKQLLVFQRTHERPAGIAMKSVARDLTRQNMQDVAAFLQALPSL